MYDPVETDLSLKELAAVFRECSKGIPICVIGGWAAYLYVNENYKRAFGQDYMGSRDIDIFFDPEKAEEFSKVIAKRGFTKNGFYFRYEKIYDRECRAFITQEQAKQTPVFNLLYIFLDLFSNKKTQQLDCWWNLEPLKKISFFNIGKFVAADIDTLVASKCVALFARDKADKENKDACDLYALIRYSGKKILSTELLEKAVQKILSRPDLLYAIAEHVLLDPGRQNIVEVVLNDKLEEIQNNIRSSCS